MRTTHRGARFTLILGCLIVGGMAAALLAQNKPPLGTWKLNLSKSKLPTGPAPKSAILKIEAAGMAVTTTADLVLADGSTQHWMYTGNYDGKDVPVTGAQCRAIPPGTDDSRSRRAGKLASFRTELEQRQTAGCSSPSQS
jgi:hypothetical protein